jgi:hypothetical protein
VTEITNGTINGALRKNKKRQPGSRLKTSDRVLRYIRALRVRSMKRGSGGMAFPITSPLRREETTHIPQYGRAL